VLKDIIYRYVWHITHRCHKREFLLKFPRDRRRWIEWLYQAKKRYSGLSVLNYMVTSNHIHLLAMDNGGRNVIPDSIKLAAGRTGQEYNIRKNRKGAFWEGYAEQLMKRIRELIETVTRVYPQDRFFLDFEESCRTNAAKGAAYRTYNDALQVLDGQSWQILKDKAVAHFRDHRRGQLKQGFFNQLNEAFAYRFLVRRGCIGVVMLPERGASTPDIRYVEAGWVKHCEVKTLGLSDEEIHRRGGI